MAYNNFGNLPGTSQDSSTVTNYIKQLAISNANATISPKFIRYMTPDMLAVALSPGILSSYQYTYLADVNNSLIDLGAPGPDGITCTARAISAKSRSLDSQLASVRYAEEIFDILATSCRSSTCSFLYFIPHNAYLILFNWFSTLNMIIDINTFDAFYYPVTKYDTVSNTESILETSFTGLYTPNVVLIPTYIMRIGTNAFQSINSGQSINYNGMLYSSPTDHSFVRGILTGDTIYASPIGIAGKIANWGQRASRGNISPLIFKITFNDASSGRYFNNIQQNSGIYYVGSMFPNTILPLPYSPNTDINYDGIAVFMPVTTDNNGTGPRSVTTANIRDTLVMANGLLPLLMIPSAGLAIDGTDTTTLPSTIPFGTVVTVAGNSFRVFRIV